ncbi:hypothetical protein PENPOL_c006G05465 [Penicillium polonicum]|uniref:Uncharacterized protein n=1 Tax=Penicillium polonicum TaxID=60169 RepID=A0A1V6NLN1_PENPO|nr:hypothetical protein PENPOL_c006G05465 [Penicillium polonicum]
MSSRALAVPNIGQSDVELPPGRWAEYAISLPWDTARRGTHIRTDLLAILRGHELQRELVYLHRGGLDLCDRKLDGRPMHILPRGEGDFPLVRSKLGACPNCWWPTPARRCSLEFTTRALAASAAFFQSSSKVLNRPQVRRAPRERTGALAATTDRQASR